MKRKISLLFLTIMVTIPILYACNDKEDVSTLSSDLTTLSIDSSDSESPDEPEAMGGISEAKIVQDYISLHKGDDHEAVSANGDGGSIGMYFKTNMTLFSISFECPSWSDDIGQMTLDIYKWDTDYATTLAGTPILTETEHFTDYADNDTVEVLLPENVFAPGEYLYIFRDGRDGVGMWKSVESVEGIQSYFKGEPVSGVYKTYLYGWYEE